MQRGCPGGALTELGGARTLNRVNAPLSCGTFREKVERLYCQRVRNDAVLGEGALCDWDREVK
jgi:hypothetical protein